MRYIVYGAGAVGGAIGGRLFEHGRDVVLIARGAHRDAIAANGLTLNSPDGSVTHAVPVVGAPSEIEFRDGDVVILGMKTQDTAAALDALAAVASATTPVVCAQNGVENERLALRRFANVYGMCVMLPATHLEPAHVDVNSSPVSGILDLGRVPRGVDATAETVAADLSASSFSSQADPAIMRRKYAKLLMNLGNSLDAAAGGDARANSELGRRARREALAVFAAAGIDLASQEEDAARRGNLLTMRPIAGHGRSGSSSWQSLARGTGSIESDYLNGEIVLLGREHDIPTPVNELLRSVANRMARNGEQPGSMSVADLEAGLT